MLRRWSTNSRPESRPWAARPGREEGQVLGSSNDVLGIEYGLPLVDLLDLLGLPPPLQLKSGAKASYNHSLCPLIRPIFADGGRIKDHTSRLLFLPLLLEYFGVRRTASQSATRYLLRDPLLVRLLLVLLSQYLPSRVSAPIRYGWYCGWRRCSKVPVRWPFFGSPLDSRWIPTLMSDCGFSCNPETPPHQPLLRMTSQILRLLQRKKNQIFLTPPLTQHSADY